MNESDYELIKLVREKDDKIAFRMLYDRYWDKLYHLGLNKVGIEEDVCDIVQELFTTIWAKRKTLNIICNVDLYLYKSLKNRITNYYKKKYLIEEKLTKNTIQHTTGTESNAENICSFKEVQFIIHREVQSMPEKMKRVFLLSREEHLSSKIISERLSLSDQTVRNQISKAIKRIKLKLDQFGVTG